jgi:hypothetical protein
MPRLRALEHHEDVAGESQLPLVSQYEPWIADLIHEVIDRLLDLLSQPRLDFDLDS